MSIPTEGVLTFLGARILVKTPGDVSKRFSNWAILTKVLFLST
jgi:hypothetical protein